ncbi:hypothetical protein PM082_011854 [Marasmius tenuissimus]|nr:hypothetical protein PM082_011854 [Marasmius tenuissimus]
MMITAMGVLCNVVFGDGCSAHSLLSTNGHFEERKTGYEEKSLIKRCGPGVADNVEVKRRPVITTYVSITNPSWLLSCKRFPNLVQWDGAEPLLLTLSLEGMCASISPEDVLPYARLQSFINQPEIELSVLQLSQ